MASTHTHAYKQTVNKLFVILILLHSVIHTVFASIAAWFVFHTVNTAHLHRRHISVGFSWGLSHTHHHHHHVCVDATALSVAHYCRVMGLSLDNVKHTTLKRLAETLGIAISVCCCLKVPDEARTLNLMQQTVGFSLELGIPLASCGTSNGLKTVQQRNVQIREFC